MSKQCKSCGSNMPSDAKFCQACGGSEFIVNNSTPNQPTFNQNQFNQQSPINQSWQPAVPQNQPKKKKTGLVIGIIAAVLLVLAGIGFIAEKAFQDEGYGGNSNNNDYGYNDITNNNSEEIPEKIYYSEGTFDGSVYENKWADIKFVMPEGFSNADLATYSAVENASTECGMYFIADDTMSLIYICYEKLPSFPVYDEEKYLDSAMKSLENVSGVTYTIPNTYSTATIGGYAYAKAECGFNNGNGDFSNTFYVRKLDGYMICISAIGVNSASNDALVANITTAKEEE